MAVALPADYHYKQAQVLARLADATRDPETARALLQLSAEHVRLAESTPNLRLVSREEK
jgi:hypothetical protein